MTVSDSGADGEAGSLTLRYLPAAACPPPGPGPARPGDQPGVTVQDVEVSGRPAQVQSFDGGCVVLQTDRPDDAMAAVVAPVQLVSRADLDAEASQLTGGWASTLTAGS